MISTSYALTQLGAKMMHEERRGDRIYSHVRKRCKQDDCGKQITEKQQVRQNGLCDGCYKKNKQAS